MVDGYDRAGNGRAGRKYSARTQAGDWQWRSVRESISLNDHICGLPGTATGFVRKTRLHSFAISVRWFAAQCRYGVVGGCELDIPEFQTPNSSRIEFCSFGNSLLDHRHWRLRGWQSG